MAAFVQMTTTRIALFRSSFRNSCVVGLQKEQYRTRAATVVRMMCASPEAPDTVMESVKRKLSDALSPDRLNVVPTYGDPNGSHVSIEVVSKAFEGLNVVKRHQAVYKVIWEELQVRYTPVGYCTLSCTDAFFVGSHSCGRPTCNENAARGFVIRLVNLGKLRHTFANTLVCVARPTIRATECAPCHAGCPAIIERY